MLQTNKFDPSLIPEHDSSEYQAWSSGMDSDKVRELQYCGSAWDTYTEELRWALTMNGRGSSSDVANLSDEEVYHEVANQIWFGKLVVVRDLLDQSPQKWLLSPDNIAQGQLDSNRRDASWRRRTEGQNDFAQENNLATDPPASMPVPAPIVDQQHWIHIDVIDDQTGQPIRGVNLKITVPEGSKGSSGTYKTDNAGNIEIISLKPGTCQVESPAESITLKNTLVYMGTGNSISASKKQSARPKSGSYSITKVIKYQTKSGDTLASIAQAYDLSVEQIAKFNWDTNDTKQIRTHLLQDVGAMPPANVDDEVSFGENAKPGVILIPLPWSPISLRTMSSSTLRVAAPAQLIPPSAGAHITDVKWLQPRVRVGEEIKLQFSYRGFNSKDSMVIKVYEFDKNGVTDLVDTITTSSVNPGVGQHQATWSRTVQQAKEDQQQDKAAGDTGPLEYRFEVEVNGAKATKTSGPLWLTKTVIIEPNPENEISLPDGLQLELTEADGTKHIATVENGTAIFEEIVVGPIQVAIKEEV